MKYIKNKKIKTYTSLTLALTLASPISSFASEDLENPSLGESVVVTEKEILEDEADRAYIEKISMSLSEDGKKASYKVNISKNEYNSKIKAYVYLAESSNLDNISALGVDASPIFDEPTSMEKLGIDLGEEDTEFTIDAGIKEGFSKNLSFDLVLVSEDGSIKEAKRLVTEVSGDNGNISLIETPITGVASLLDGKLVGDNSIKWTDYLLNTSDSELSIEDYFLNPSSNQNFNSNAISIETFAIGNDGYELVGDRITTDIENLKNITIPAKSLVKVSLDGIVDSQKDSLWSVNGIDISKEEPVLEKDNDDVANQASKDVNTITENLEDKTEEIKDTIVDIDNEEELADKNQKDQDQNQDQDQSNENIEYQKEIKTSSLDSKEKTHPIKSEEDTNKSKEINSFRIDNKAEEANKSSLDVVEITRNLNDVTANIKEVISLIDEENELLSSDVKKDLKLSDNKDSDYVKDLTKKIQTSNQKVQEELGNIYGKTAIKSIMTLSNNIDDQTYKLLTELESASDKTDELARQINLSIETGRVLDNPEEKSQIVAIIKDLETIETNNKKVLEEIETKKADDKEISPNFDIVVEEFSQNLYKDFKKVATVTLDPLDKNSPTIDASKAKENYPTITSYLENLDLRYDLLNK